tara:strand:+ start:377 stop:1087 length:711 start_codon:yes stop_codon:yes gene_type:complete
MATLTRSERRKQFRKSQKGKKGGLRKGSTFKKGKTDEPANDAIKNPKKKSSAEDLHKKIAAKEAKRKADQEASLNKTKIQPGEKTTKEKNAKARKNAVEEANKKKSNKPSEQTDTQKKQQKEKNKGTKITKDQKESKIAPKKERKKDKLKMKGLQVEGLDPKTGSKLPKKFDKPKPRKMSKLEKQNRARHGDKAIDHLQSKNKDFQAMKKGKLSKADFIKKYPKSITAQKAAGLRR